MSQNVYEIVTARILEILDSGTVPWAKPWTITKTIDDQGNPVLHQNLVSKKPYRGINPFLLDCTAMARGYNSPYWLSFKQITALGGKLKPGQNKGNDQGSTMITFWKFLQVENKAKVGELKNVPMLRYYNVFNFDQTEGIDLAKIPFLPVEGDLLDFDPIPKCQAIIEGYKGAPIVKHEGSRAFYRPSTDGINMPPKEAFVKETAYYTTLFHEFGHSTGHKDRLDRTGDGLGKAAFGSGSYSKEELVAEMSASMLAGHAGILDDTIEQSAAYIQSWRQRLSKDPKLVVQAAGKAQKAVDHILGVVWDNDKPTSDKLHAPMPAMKTDPKPAPKQIQGMLF